MDELNTIKWYIDAAFGVHKDLKSQTGAVMTLGSGVLSSISTKQKVNSRSSTEAEFLAVDDVINKVLWTKLFLESQGLKIAMNIIYRDNQSSNEDGVEWKIKFWETDKIFQYQILLYHRYH
jgi:hypothetical protein